jgi:hypothetical protein
MLKDLNQIKKECKTKFSSDLLKNYLSLFEEFEISVEEVRYLTSGYLDHCKRLC